MLETNVKIIKHKVGLLNLPEKLGNVFRACKTMGLSRDTFYRYKAVLESGGVESPFGTASRLGRISGNPVNPQVLQIPVLTRNPLMRGTVLMQKAVPVTDCVPGAFGALHISPPWAQASFPDR